MCQSSGETTVFVRHLVLVILYEWLSGMHPARVHTRQSSTQNNKYQVSHKHSCFSWWWAHSRPKRVQTLKYTKNKYIKNKLCTNLALFTRLNGDERSTEHKICCNTDWCFRLQVDITNISWKICSQCQYVTDSNPHFALRQIKFVPSRVKYLSCWS